MYSTNKYYLKTKYANYKAVMRIGTYGNGTPALRFEIARTGEPILTASVALDTKPSNDDNILIKNWSENEGIQIWLEKNGLIGPPIMHHPTGFIEATEHKMKGDLLALWHRYNSERAAK